MENHDESGVIIDSGVVARCNDDKQADRRLNDGGFFQRQDGAKRKKSDEPSFAVVKWVDKPLSLAAETTTEDPLCEVVGIVRETAAIARQPAPIDLRVMIRKGYEDAKASNRVFGRILRTLLTRRAFSIHMAAKTACTATDTTKALVANAPLTIHLAALLPFPAFEQLHHLYRNSFLKSHLLSDHSSTLSDQLTAHDAFLLFHRHHASQVSQPAEYVYHIANALDSSDPDPVRFHLHSFICRICLVGNLSVASMLEHQQAIYQQQSTGHHGGGKHSRFCEFLPTVRCPYCAKVQQQQQGPPSMLKEEVHCLDTDFPKHLQEKHPLTFQSGRYRDDLERQFRSGDEPLMFQCSQCLQLFTLVQYLLHRVEQFVGGAGVMCQSTSKCRVLHYCSICRSFLPLECCHRDSQLHFYERWHAALSAASAKKQETVRASGGGKFFRVPHDPKSGAVDDEKTSGSKIVKSDGT